MTACNLRLWLHGLAAAAAGGASTALGQILLTPGDVHWDQASLHRYAAAAAGGALIAVLAYFRQSPLASGKS
ncbi:MAG: hypothetical protein ACRD2H_06420 [Terriglobales bacterium]